VCVCVCVWENPKVDNEDKLRELTACTAGVAGMSQEADQRWSLLGAQTIRGSGAHRNAGDMCRCYLPVSPQNGEENATSCETFRSHSTGVCVYIYVPAIVRSA